MSKRHQYPWSMRFTRTKRWIARISFITFVLVCLVWDIFWVWVMAQ